MQSPTTNLLIFSALPEMGYLAATHIYHLSTQAIEARKHFRVAISGGSLIKLLAPALTSAPLNTLFDWSAWQLFWVDERCVPLDHVDSNYRLAREQFLDKVDIPEQQIYTVDTTLPPDAAARAYEQTLANVFGGEQLPRFDLILLGMGDDGHTASLFPNHSLMQEQKRWVAPISDSPKPPPERVTLTLPIINNARRVAFVATGENKAAVLSEVLNPATFEEIPAKLIQPTRGEIFWYVDEAAAAQLDD
ncbi:MAG: 6-phosphogluconolactonase [Chloroflexota bacterium]